MKNLWKHMDPGCRVAVLVSFLTFGLVCIHLVGGDPDELGKTVRSVAEAAAVLNSAGAFAR